MPFTPKDWRDFPETSTPITAAALEDVESRLSTYTDRRSGIGGLPIILAGHSESFFIAGATSQNVGWASRVAQIIGFRQYSIAEGGACLANWGLKDINDGTGVNPFNAGYAQIYRTLLGDSVAYPPYQVEGDVGMVIMQFGIADAFKMGSGNVEAFKSALRGVCSRIMALGGVYGDESAQWGHSAGALAGGNALTNQARGHGTDYRLMTTGSTSTFTVPSNLDQAPRTVAVGYRLTTGDNGSVAFTVNGGGVNVNGNATLSLNAGSGLVSPQTIGSPASAWNTQVGRILGVPAGATVVATHTVSAGSARLDFAQIESGVDRSPVIMVSNIPRRFNYAWGSGEPFPPDDALVNTYNAAIASVAGEFPPGAVTVVDVDTALNKDPVYFGQGDGAGSGDQLHLNPAGHQKVAETFLAALPDAVWSRVLLLAGGADPYWRTAASANMIQTNFGISSTVDTFFPVVSAGVMKDATGRVHMRGHLYKTSAWADNDIPMILARGYRPAYSMSFTVATSGGPRELQVREDGGVVIQHRGAAVVALGATNSGGWVALNNISFQAKPY